MVELVRFLQLSRFLDSGLGYGIYNLDETFDIFIGRPRSATGPDNLFGEHGILVSMLILNVFGVGEEESVHPPQNISQPPKNISMHDWLDSLRCKLNEAATHAFVLWQVFVIFQDPRQSMLIDYSCFSAETPKSNASLGYSIRHPFPSQYERRRNVSRRALIYLLSRLQGKYMLEPSRYQFHIYHK